MRVRGADQDIPVTVFMKAHYAFRTVIIFWESQRDSVPQPRVAAEPLPWDMRHISVTYPKGVASLNVETTSNFNRRNPVGVVFIYFNDPRVVQPLADQTRAGGRCPVGACTDEESCIGEPAARNAY